MRALILGGGGREHAVAWKFSRSRRISGLFVGPGNVGTEGLAEALDLNPDDPASVVAACRDNRVNLVFVGPEAPLAAGVVDELRAAGIPAVGPDKRAAQLESSKAFSKAFMARNQVPTAAFEVCGDANELSACLKRRSGRIVVKKSGLASGKGVYDGEDRRVVEAAAFEALRDGPVVVEEFLEGFEVSVFVISDGVGFRVLPACADYKKAGDGGTGPNTGGMGAVCPVPWLSAEVWAGIIRDIVEPTFRGLRAEELAYKGVVYIGVIVTADGPRVLEYNVRFGDPETQALLPLLRCDFGDLCAAIVDGTLDSFPVELSQRHSVGVVVAAGGYPGSYDTGHAVEFGELPRSEEGAVFHGSTYRDSDGVVRTGGGRCFTAVGVGESLLEARNLAYRWAQSIRFPGAWYRSDVGGRIFGN